MLAIEVRWRTGRFHATPWGRHVNEGAVEWPPSPWRLLRALIASWKAHAAHVSQSEIQSLVTALSATPPLFLLPVSHSLGHTRHYVPSGNTQRLVLDAFIIIDRADSVIFQWPELVLDAPALALLDQLLEGLAYFGRSESWAVLSRTSRRGSANCRPLLEGMDPHSTLLCPEPEVTVDQLLESTASLRKRRYNRPPGSFWLPYRLPAPEPEKEPAWRPRLVTFLVLDPMPQEQTLPLAERIRRALLALGDPSPTLLGKEEGAPRRDGHRHLHILPQASAGQIERVHLWAPEGFGHRDLRLISRLHSLHATRQQRPIRLLLLETRTEAGLGRSSVWRSSSPFLGNRHPKPNGEDAVPEQVRRECHLRGLPEPSVEELPGDGREYELSRGKKRLPLTAPAWLRLIFPTSIDGPLCLGAHSHFGMGQFTPEEPLHP